MDYNHLSGDESGRLGSERASESMRTKSSELGLQDVSDVHINLRTVPGGIARIVPTPPTAISPRDSTFSQASTPKAHPTKSPEAMSFVSAVTDRDSCAYPQSRYASEAELLKLDQKPGSSSGCPTHGDLLKSPWSILTVTILFLAAYSTIFSGIFLGIAVAQPRWGLRIGTPGRMSYPTATLLSALFSKMIELSFVSVYVALLGQLLSRRAFSRKTRHGRGEGISISDMSMRIWIMQPGSLITHWETIRYAGWTALGLLTLLATFSSTFYTTAAEALVAPKLSLGAPNPQVLAGNVSTGFGNATYLKRMCKTPVTEEIDWKERGLSCRQIDYAGQSFRDFSTWLDEWQQLSVHANNSVVTSVRGRPVATSILYENTTVAGQWITSESDNITAASAEHGRFVNNVTLAMPHANIFNAARNRQNGIPQPEDFLNQGQYEINASIPVMALNVLCVGVSTQEVNPLIFNNSDTETRHQVPPTPVDYLFDFGKGPGQQKAAQFPKIPQYNNTVYNASEGPTSYGQEAVYILATPPIWYATNYHMMCSIKALTYANCSTRYFASDTQGDISVYCDERLGSMKSYLNVNPEVPLSIVNYDWKDIGIGWAKATSLNQGIFDGDATIARLISQFIPQNSSSGPVSLAPRLPSVAESLAVLGANTLVKGSSYAPFVHFWNHTDLREPEIQYFDASVRYKAYASGSTQKWQGVFYLVLAAVFLINIYALVFLIKKVFINGQVTDYTEPENLFAIANLSPPSASLHGACGAGPTGNMLSKKWKVDMHDVSEHSHGGQTETEYSPHSPYSRGQKQHPHFYVKCMDDEELSEWAVAEEAELRQRKTANKDKRKSRPSSVHDWHKLDDLESPAIDQYRRLVS
jgi:hypothetical protein